MGISKHGSFQKYERLFNLFKQVTEVDSHNGAKHPFNILARIGRQFLLRVYNKRGAYIEASRIGSVHFIHLGVFVKASPFSWWRKFWSPGFFKTSIPGVTFKPWCQYIVYSRSINDLDANAVTPEDMNRCLAQLCQLAEKLEDSQDSLKSLNAPVGLGDQLETRVGPLA